ncbi:MAG: FkbM family methyltransferase [Pirellulales bacterium]
MKQVAGIYLPDGEAHMPSYLQQSGGVYQSKQLNRALEFVADYRTAIDIGAHVGMWSKILVGKFQRVVAFEPMRPLRECLEKNVVSDRIQIVPIALGNRHGSVSFDYDESHTGATHIDAKRHGLIPLGMLDDFHIENVGFIKIDVEGFELDVLEGARETLLANHPVIIVEDKQHGVKHYGQKPYALIDYLESLGGVIMDRVIDDFVIGWPDAPGKVKPAQQRTAETQMQENIHRHNAGDLHGARIGYRKLAREFPRNAEVRNMSAIVEMQLGELQNAVESALTAVEMSPRDAKYQNTLATALWMNGMTAEAISTLKRAITIDPDLFEAHLNLAGIHEQNNDPAAAFAGYQQALRIKPNSPQVLTKMGRIHATHGSTAQASTLFRQALAMNPENETARQGLRAIEGSAAR